MSAVIIVLSFQPIHAQEKLAWLDDYTGEMLIGTDTYRYHFTNVDGNDCKIKIDEQVTDKKGSLKTHSWVFYLSDINPSSLSFKAKGKSLEIVMETHQSQKFITYYEEGAIDGYTEIIRISMNEVDQTRTFLETFKENVSHCKETQVSWENRDQAFTWLVNNIVKATYDGTEWDQQFKPGKRNYLVDFQANSVNEKGDQKLFGYTLDLNDINPLAIQLKISGKSLLVEVPVKESNKYVKVESPTGTVFTDVLQIYANGIELARQIVNALSYLVTNTTSERQQWDSYVSSLEFVQENLGEVKVVEELYTNRFNFNPSPAGLVEFTIGKSDSKGTAESETYAFYLSDIEEKLKLEVSKSSITIRLETKNKQEFIRVSKENKVTDYSSTVGLQMADIDRARDILNALEYAVSQSKEEIREFSNLSETASWISENVVLIETDGDKFEQNISIIRENENQLLIEKKLTGADQASTETSFILYTEDISLDDLGIKVSGKKLSVPLVTDQGKYIKNFENGKLQNFTGATEILFLDPLVAKNFMAAIRFLKENTVADERTAMSPEEARAFLLENIQNIELTDDKYEQKLEFKEEGKCQMSFTRTETDKKGANVEYTFEFNVSDIHPGNSKFSIKGEIVAVNLITNGNEKLIKPHKNGEAGDFVDDFFIYIDDVLLARKTLAAFASLSKGCE
ncbi:MAG: hypothetical protein R6W31_00725 [Bacteroidales bacterium]